MNRDYKAYLNTIANDIESSNNINDKIFHICNAINTLFEDFNFTDELLNSFSENKDKDRLFAFCCRFALSLQISFELLNKKWDLKMEEDETERALLYTIKNIADKKLTLEKRKDNSIELKKKTDDLQNSNQELLKEEDKFLKLDSEHKQLQEKINRLQEIKDNELEPKIIQLKQEEKRLIMDTKEAEGTIKELGNQNAKYSKTLQSLENTIKSRKAGLEKIVEDITTVINERYEDIKEIYDNSTRSIDDMKREIEDIREKYKRLDDQQKETLDILNNNKAHFDENSEIVKNMEKYYGIKDGFDGISKRINETKMSIEDGLKIFDEELKKVIEESIKSRDEILEKIKNI